jgi:drug/metabolite transporter (DMT)-like permease
VTHSFLYALISMLFAGANDTLLKKQAISGHCQSQYMAVAGVVWSSVFICSAFYRGQYLPSPETISWTLAIGVLSAFANYMLIYSMRKLEAGVASTIYRLNLALAAIIAFVFLAEPINLLKICGLILACSAVFCFVQHQQKIISKGVWPMLLVVVIASAMRAVYGICYKIALAKGVQYMWLLSGPGLGWTVLGTITAFNSGGLRIPVGNLLRGVFSGFLLCGLIFFFAKALEDGQASVIIPISQMSFVITAVLAWLFFKEKPSVRKIVGLVLACLSISILSQSG